MHQDLPGALVAATDPRATRLEDLQFTLGEGPCTQSVVTGRPVLVEDLAAKGSSWPAFTTGAVEAGIAAVFAFPLRVGQTTVGVLDLYRVTVGPLTTDDVDEAMAFSTVATWVLLDLYAALAEHQHHPELAGRLTNRFQVHQASGVVAVQLSVQPEVALDLLRARALVDGRSIDDLAADVVAGLVILLP